MLLETFLRTERESSVQLVTVIGEPGIGKSRLVTELRHSLDDRPEIVTWRQGRCLPYGEGITFWALGEIVKAEAGILESDDPARRRVEARRGGRGPVRGRVGARVVRLAARAAGRRRGTTGQRRPGRGVHGLAPVPRGDGRAPPCVLVVEDLHWADGALLEFLEHLLDWAPPVPLLLLCTARPELYERQPSWGGGKRNSTTISLSPLSTEETARSCRFSSTGRCCRPRRRRCCSSARAAIRSTPSSSPGCSSSAA